MKKIIVGAFLVFSFASFAAYENVAKVQIANSDELTKAAMAFGNLIGQPMVGSMAAGAIPGLPWIKLFGAIRSDASSSVLLGVDWDTQALLKEIGTSAKCADLDKYVRYSMLLSPLGGKAKFLERNPAAVERDGALFLNEEKSGFNGDVFVAYSDDGKWAAVASDAATAKKALSGVKTAQRPMGGRVLALTVSSSAMSVVAKAVETARAKNAEIAKGVDESIVRLLESISGLTGSVKVSDKGIDFSMGLVPAPASDLAKIGKKSLSGKPLAFAGKNVISASATAAGCGAQDSVEAVKKILNVLKDNGIDTTAFLTVKSSGSLYDFAFDVRKLVAWAEAQAGQSHDLCKICEEISAIPEMKGGAFKVDTPERQFVCSLVGYEGKASVQSRFEATLPEAAGKPLYNAQFFSLYSLLKAVAPICLEKLPEDQREMLKPILGQLPEEGLGGMAGMGWTENGVIRAFARLSADELKGLSGAYNVVMGAVMMQAMQGAGGTDGDDGDEDED